MKTSNARKIAWPMILGAVAGLFVLFPPVVPGGDVLEKDPASKYAGPLRRVVEIRPEFQTIHPILGHLYPIAVAEDGKLFIFSPDAARAAYALTAAVSEPFPMPKGIRASFPLAALGNKPACVVTGEVFDTPAGLVTIFHEFVHCRQFETVETKLKGGLEIYRRALENKNFMWELEYPFPYADPEFEKSYGASLEALESGDAEKAGEIRRGMRRTLSPGDFEYLAWQEWKEGLARYFENLMRARIGLGPNDGGKAAPFSRVSFYAGGDRSSEYWPAGRTWKTWRPCFRAIASFGE